MGEFSIATCDPDISSSHLKRHAPHEENLIDPTELNLIREELDKFEQSLEEKDISPDVRQYVKRQFSFMRRAIWEYQFRGLHAFDDALLDTLREASISRGIVEKHKDEPEVKEVGKVWGKLWQAVIKAGQIGTALAGAERIYQLVESTLKITGHHP